MDSEDTFNEPEEALPILNQALSAFWPRFALEELFEIPPVGVFEQNAPGITMLERALESDETLCITRSILGNLCEGLRLLMEVIVGSAGLESLQGIAMRTMLRIVLPSSDLIRKGALKTYQSVMLRMYFCSADIGASAVANRLQTDQGQYAVTWDVSMDSPSRTGAKNCHRNACA